MNDKIKKFIQQQTCAAVCCVDEAGNPYCFSCFYAFDAGENFLYFKSSNESHHAALIKQNPAVAGTIMPDKLNVFQMKGIQFEGMIVEKNDERALQASDNYHKRHPMAYAVPGKVWTIRIDKIKFTDNSPGFGKKITWKRYEMEENSSN